MTNTGIDKGPDSVPSVCIGTRSPYNLIHALWGTVWVMNWGTTSPFSHDHKYRTTEKLRAILLWDTLFIFTISQVFPFKFSNMK